MPGVETDKFTRTGVELQREKVMKCLGAVAFISGTVSSLSPNLFIYAHEIRKFFSCGYGQEFIFSTTFFHNTGYCQP